MCDTNTDNTICMLENSARIPYTDGMHEVEKNDYCGCSGIEQFRGGRHGGGRHGSWGRGYRNWRGGYSGFGYYPYAYGSHYYWPDYYDYPFVSNQPILKEVVKPGVVNGHVTFTLALVALIVAFFALRK